MAQKELLMNSVTVQIDYGAGTNGGVLAYFFDSEHEPKAIMAQALVDGYVLVPAGATSLASGGNRKEQHDTYFPLGRVVSIN
jgi:hypothetical protein